MNETKNIIQRMKEVTARIGTVKKGLEVEITSNSKYKAVSERDILIAVKPLEEEVGIYSYPIAREVVSEHLLESETEYNGKKSKKVQFWVRVKTKYRFVNTDNPADYIEVESFGDGIDTQDKAVGKATTYADKYALMKAYKVATGDEENLTEQFNQMTKQADENQLKEIAALKIDLKGIQSRFKVERFEDLSFAEAALVIKMKKAAKK